MFIEPPPELPPGESTAVLLTPIEPFDAIFELLTILFA